MSVTLKYVGKKSEYVGKTLWEIVGNLKDFGVGRIFVRNMEASRYSEPCFMKILEVKAQPNEVPPKIEVIRPPNDLRDKDRPRQVHVLCEYVFRGVKYDNPVLIAAQSSVPDFRLIPKHLEKNYVATKTYKQKVDENILPRYIEFPPLLKEMIVRSGAQEPKMKLVTKITENSLYRIAEEGEQPTKQLEVGFGTPKSPNLYTNVNYNI